MKKIKLKKKNILILSISIVILIVLVASMLLLLNNNQKNKIKNNYNEYVTTNKNAKLYDKEENVIGTVSKGVELHLDKQKKDSKYYKIIDSDCYIYYQDVNKVKNNKLIQNNYIVFNKNVKSNNKVDLYKDGKKLITLNKIDAPILYIKENSYYINFLNDIYEIKKSKNIKEIEKENTKEEETKILSIINYNQIEDTCSNNDCVETNAFKAHLAYIKNNNFYAINKDELKLYINKEIRLKKTPVLITVTNYNEKVESIAKELDITIVKNDDLKLNSTNKTNTKENTLDNLNKYDVKKYTTAENFIRMVNGEEVYEASPEQKVYNTKNQGIAVLNYHFFYDPTIGEECNESICLTKQKFEEHLKYFKDNNYKTLSMKEFVRWYNGEIELPEKSVLITVDDGAMGTGKHNGNILNPLLEKYNLRATLFLISGWWDIGNYISPNLDIQSHTYDMHNYGDCDKGQLVCADYATAKKDLELSLEVVGSKDSFCYPFYAYDDEAIQAVKDVGFQVAFGGGNRKATRNSNRYIIPRYPIVATHTLNDIIRMVS